MNKLKHTPGPWSYEEWCDDEFCIFDYTGISVCNLHANGNIESNGRLIASAPEMLEILIKQYKWLIATQQIYNPVEMLFVISEVREIIEKATGLKIEEVIK